ncbi:hypothetical protein Celaphus_00016182, partial [Cervus elaphus hippelaphus]
MGRGRVGSGTKGRKAQKSQQEITIAVGACMAQGPQTSHDQRLGARASIERTELLQKYFDMGKKQCRESLDIYIKFLERMTKLGRFLKVAEVQKSISSHGFCYTMSAFIRRYSKYLNEKSLAYRLMESDITKTKRGTDGVMRTMNTKQLLNTLPVIQIQFDALLNFNANADELTNGIIHAAFMLLFKDSLRLFAAYNEGILNLLENDRQAQRHDTVIDGLDRAEEGAERSCGTALAPSRPPT